MLLHPIVYYYFFGSLGLGVAFIWITVNTPLAYRLLGDQVFSLASLCFNLTAVKIVIYLHAAFYIFHSSLEVSLSIKIFSWRGFFGLLNPALLCMFD